MQTFLPYKQFHISASVLDNRRLGCQVKEAAQIYDALVNGSHWSRHWAVQMWGGYRTALLMYGVEMYREWQLRFERGERGGKKHHKSGEKLIGLLVRRIDFAYGLRPIMPWWLGSDRFHAAYRAALLFKLPEWYTQFEWGEEPVVQYLRPQPDGTFLIKETREVVR